METKDNKDLEQQDVHLDLDTPVDTVDTVEEVKKPATDGTAQSHNEVDPA